MKILDMIFEPTAGEELSSCISMAAAWCLKNKCDAHFIHNSRAVDIVGCDEHLIISIDGVPDEVRDIP